MVDAGCTGFVVLGSGQHLARFSERTAPGIPFVTVDRPERIAAAVDLSEALKRSQDPGKRPVPAPATRSVGERMSLTERIVVAPNAGKFEPSAIRPGDMFEPGTVLGWVSGTEVTSIFTGEVAEFLVTDGERVKRHARVVWLRCCADTHRVGAPLSAAGSGTAATSR